MITTDNHQYHVQSGSSLTKPRHRISSMAGESLLRSFSGLLFGSFNSIQIFLYPGLLLYWLESTSLVYSLSDLVTSRLHYVPLIIFLLVFVYMILILLKNEYYLRRVPDGMKHAIPGEFTRFVVDIHAKLLILIIVFMVLYVLSVFFKYFYGISVPLKAILSYGLRMLGMLLIMYYYVLHSWIAPWRKRGHGYSACRIRLLAFIKTNPGHFIRFTVFMIALAFLFAKFYTLMLQYIYMPVLAIMGAMLDIHPHISLHAFSSISATVYNLLMVVLAVLLSNLFFIPLIWLAGKMLDRLHPVR